MVLLKVNWKDPIHKEYTLHVDNREMRRKLAHLKGNEIKEFQLCFKATCYILGGVQVIDFVCHHLSLEYATQTSEKLIQEIEKAFVVIKFGSYLSFISKNAWKDIYPVFLELQFLNHAAKMSDQSEIGKHDFIKFR